MHSWIRCFHNGQTETTCIIGLNKSDFSMLLDNLYSFVLKCMVVVISEIIHHSKLITYYPIILILFCRSCNEVLWPLFARYNNMGIYMSWGSIMLYLFDHRPVMVPSILVNCRQIWNCLDERHFTLVTILYTQQYFSFKLSFAVYYKILVAYTNKETYQIIPFV